VNGPGAGAGAAAGRDDARAVAGRADVVVLPIVALLFVAALTGCAFPPNSTSPSPTARNGSMSGYATHRNL
jgi:hypothetical protein